MSDIRALLAQERQSRRVNHPNASYSKSNVLSCNVCHLNIKSEALWDGHLKSANHRKNAQRSQEAAPKSMKRKIDEVGDTSIDDRGYEVDNRKKPKSKAVKFVDEPEILEQRPVVDDESFTTDTEPTIQQGKQELEVAPANAVTSQAVPVDQPSNHTPQQNEVDEDEWAAFEREIAPLTRPDYSSATISAAPVSAAQMEAEAAVEQKKLRDIEGEEEKEDEGRRLEEEFDVMEEMEERVRKLREKREALRSVTKGQSDTGQGPATGETHNNASSETNGSKAEETFEESEEDDEVDDWYS